MRRFIIVALIALTPTLAGCAVAQKLQDSLTVVTSASVSPKNVVVAAKSFNFLEGLATKYLSLPRCNGAPQVCRDPAITRQVIPAVRKGRRARDTLIAFQRAHPGELGSQGAYDALIASIATLKDIISKNAGAIQ